MTFSLRALIAPVFIVTPLLVLSACTQNVAQSSAVLPAGVTPPVAPTYPATKPYFDAFVDSLKTGDRNQIVGVYVENRLALRVVQQPANDPGYISSNPGEATQYLLAMQMGGNIGLLAHNNLAGALFFLLQPGEVVQIIYGDGNIAEYEVVEIRQLQALDPANPYSDFVDLGSGEARSAANLFEEVYGGEHHVTLQTCIDRDNNPNWGRLFVLAPPF